MKGTSQDGKLLYVVRAGRLLTIDIEYAILVKSKDKIVPKMNNEESEGVPLSLNPYVNEVVSDSIDILFKL